MRTHDTSVTLGLVANCDRANAQEFFDSLQAKVYPGSKSAFVLRERICPKCLYDFVTENNLTVLYFDGDVEIVGLDEANAEKFLSVLSYKTGSEICIVRQD